MRKMKLLENIIIELCNLYAECSSCSSAVDEGSCTISWLLEFPKSVGNQLLEIIDNLETLSDDSLDKEN